MWELPSLKSQHLGSKVSTFKRRYVRFKFILKFFLLAAFSNDSRNLYSFLKVMLTRNEVVGILFGIFVLDVGRKEK